jgi:hypothetical protein
MSPYITPTPWVSVSATIITDCRKLNVWHFGGLQWHGIHTKFRENLLVGLKVEMDMFTQTLGGYVSFRLLLFTFKEGKRAENAE